MSTARTRTTVPGTRAETVSRRVSSSTAETDREAPSGRAPSSASATTSIPAALPVKRRAYVISSVEGADAPPLFCGRAAMPATRSGATSCSRTPPGPPPSITRRAERAGSWVSGRASASPAASPSVGSSGESSSVAVSVWSGAVSPSSDRDAASSSDPSAAGRSTSSTPSTMAARSGAPSARKPSSSSGVRNTRSPGWGTQGAAV